MKVLHYLLANKRYIGLFISIFYSLFIRVLAEVHWLDVNSWTFMYVTPGVISFIPFFLKDKKFLGSYWMCIFYPLISVLLFLTVAVINHIEDLICFIIIGLPYIGVSVLISLILKALFENRSSNLTKNAFPILVLPLLIGPIEKKFTKQKQEFTITNQIEVSLSKENVFSNLLAVPDLRSVNEKSLLNYLGVPQPLYSTYDRVHNRRLGYFDNQVVLNERVKQIKQNELVVFEIDVNSSSLDASPTFTHMIKSQNVRFNNVQYQIVARGNKKTLLKLSTKIEVYSNLTLYSRFWTNLVINDFEKNLLKSLKKKLEA
jgi:hypothetical protein